MTNRQPFPSNKTAADFDEAKLLQCFKPPCDVTATLKLCWSPASRFVAWSPGDSTVTLLPWDKTKQAVAECVTEGEFKYSRHVIHTGKPVKALALGSSVTGLSADFGTKISQPVSNNGPGHLNSNGTSQGSQEGHGHKSSWFRYHKVEGLILAAGFQNGQIRCYNAYTGDLILELLDHQQVILDVKFAPDGSLRLASCSADGRVKLWDLTDDGNMYKTLQARGYRGPVYACAWAPDATALVMVGQMGMVSLWEVSDDRIAERHTLTGHQHSVTACEFSQDGGLLLTASLDSLAILWNPYLGTKLCEYGHLFPAPSLIFASGANAAGVTGAALSADSQHMATICEDKYIRVWNLYSKDKPVQIVPPSDPGPAFCRYSPKGSTLVTGPFKGGISFFLSPPGSPPQLRQLCRSCIHHRLQKKVPGLQVASVLDDLIKEGFLPRDLRDFVQYKTLSHP